MTELRNRPFNKLYLLHENVYKESQNQIKGTWTYSNNFINLLEKTWDICVWLITYSEAVNCVCSTFKVHPTQFQASWCDIVREPLKYPQFFASQLTMLLCDNTQGESRLSSSDSVKGAHMELLTSNYITINFFAPVALKTSDKHLSTSGCVIH